MRARERSLPYLIECEEVNQIEVLYWDKSTSIIYLSYVTRRNMEEIRKNKVIRNNKEVSCRDANVQIDMYIWVLCK